MEAQVKFVRVRMWHGGKTYDFDVEPRSLPAAIQDFDRVSSVLMGIAKGLDSRGELGVDAGWDEPEKDTDGGV